MGKIGFVDLDTSHPRSFVGRINSMKDVKVTGVFDRGRKNGPDETKAFCEEYGADEFNSVEALCESCDGVMVLSADWETHFKDVQTCMNKGVPCYCDKPVFSSRQEIEEFLNTGLETRTPFFGGSGWRWNHVTQEFYRKYSKNSIKDMLVIGQSDFFYYGIHAVDWMLGLLGPGAEWVKHEVKGEDMSISSIGHNRGCVVRLMLETKPDVGRRCFANADGEDHFITFGVEEIHNGICGMFVEMVKTGIQPAGYGDYVESLLVMFALAESRETGARVGVAEAFGVDGISSEEFMKKYCRA